jgi:hypothetical protein
MYYVLREIKKKNNKKSGVCGGVGCSSSTGTTVLNVILSNHVSNKACLILRWFYLSYHIALIR